MCGNEERAQTEAGAAKEPAAATSFGCGGCSHVACSPGQAFGHAKKYLALAAVLLLALGALKMVAGRSRLA